METRHHRQGRLSQGTEVSLGTRRVAERRLLDSQSPILPGGSASNIKANRNEEKGPPSARHLRGSLGLAPMGCVIPGNPPFFISKMGILAWPSGDS